MLSDQELRARADLLREQLDATIQMTHLAIDASADIIAGNHRRRELTKSRVAESAVHIRANRNVLARGTAN